ncbi:MAG: hypothetical protein U5N86_00070 [Planctomycetota bacterium]|nr:hypothetical protein [Planctomycetota bacterium]
MTNPNVSKLQRLNYSSPRGNDKSINHQIDFFVETYLHKYLADEILDAKYKLVLITGCSGDGKTEFIQWLETEKMGEELDLSEKPIGRVDWIEYGDILFSTLYDAEMTFEEEEQGPEELLHDNLDDFTGEDWPEPQCFRIFSITRDHLRQFLQDNAEDYPKLNRVIMPALHDMDPDPRPALKEGILVVDLTFRSVVGDILREDGLEEGCVYTRVVEKMTDKMLWKPCEKCEAYSFCPVRYNMETLAPRSGKPVAERLLKLLTAFHYRRIFHLTLRDIISLLVHSFVTDSSCEEIIEEGANSEKLFPLFYFNRLFTLPGTLGILMDELDIAAVNSPGLDERLYSGEDVDNDPEHLPNMVIKDMLDGLEYIETPLAVRQTKRLLRVGRKRKLFFEYSREDEGLAMELFPYRTFDLFDAVAKKRESPGKLFEMIMKAISKREGLELNEKDRFFFTLDSNFENIATYYAGDARDFELIVPIPKTVSGHREYLPGYLLLRHRKDHIIDLRVNLDVLEYLLHGTFRLPEKPDYIPELRHRLRIFKEKLETELDLPTFYIRSENKQVAKVSRSGLTGRIDFITENE